MYQPDIGMLLHRMIEMGGSDLHLKVGSPPCIRIHGEMERVVDAPTLRPDDTQEMLLGLMGSGQRKEFEDEHELDFAYSIPGLSRFRVNTFFQRGTIGAVFRTIPIQIPTAEELGLPAIVLELSLRPRGLVLVTGPTGSGKSTTLAAMVDHINKNRQAHIMTIEDPIEFLHKDQMCIVNQREVGADTKGFTQALKRVLRQDPDVILVGEMRDLETISAACTAAETGHLVFGTLHTTSAPSTIDRVIDVFPPYQQEQIRMQLSITLQGVISQTLLPKVGGGRIAAREIMVCLTSIANLIREAKTHQMVNIIQSGSRYGMHTLDQHLVELVRGGKVTYEEALSKSQDPIGFEAQVGQFKGRGAPAPRPAGQAPGGMSGPAGQARGQAPRPGGPLPGQQPRPAGQGPGPSGQQSPGQRPAMPGGPGPGQGAPNIRPGTGAPQPLGQPGQVRTPAGGNGGPGRPVGPPDRGQS
jgi:twitching motility protein PilT